MQKLSFVIPCYRSQGSVAQVVAEVKATMSGHDDYTYEIILVDDSSPDDVFSVIKGLCAADERVRGISLAQNFGQHAALMAGYREADGDIVVTLDDDGQSPVDRLFLLLAQLEKGSDVVFAGYDELKQSAFRGFGTKLNNLMAEKLINKPKNLKLASFYVARRYVVDEMIKYDNPYPYIAGLIFRITDKLANVQMDCRERLAGKSNYNLRKLLGLWLNGFTAFSVKPLRVASVAGSLVALIGFIFGVYVVIHKLLNPAVQAGYSSLMAVILFVGGMLMMMLGLTGEYIGRVYISLNNSPQYVIRTTVNTKADNKGKRND